MLYLDSASKLYLNEYEKPTITGPVVFELASCILRNSFQILIYVPHIRTVAKCAKSMKLESNNTICTSVGGYEFQYRLLVSMDQVILLN